jgi:hypothetical protein
MDVKKTDNKKPVGILLAVTAATLFSGCTHHLQSPNPYQVSTVPQTGYAQTYHTGYNACNSKNGCHSRS